MHTHIHNNSQTYDSCVHIYIYIILVHNMYIYIHIHNKCHTIYNYYDWPFFGPRPWHIEIRDRVNKKHPQVICSHLRLLNLKFED